MIAYQKYAFVTEYNGLNVTAINKFNKFFLFYSDPKMDFFNLFKLKNCIMGMKHELRGSSKAKINDLQFLIKNYLKNTKNTKENCKYNSHFRAHFING